MKQFVFGMVLLVVVLGGAGAAQYKLEQFGRQTLAHCEKIEAMAENAQTEKLQNQVRTFAGYWQAEETLLTYFIDHEHLNVISSAMEKLQMAAGAGDALQVLLANAQIRSETQGIVEDARFRPENIF